MANFNSTKKSFFLNGEMLRLILKSKGITQQALADSIGVGKNTIYRAINFNRMENRDDFEKICAFLDIDPIVLLDKDSVSRYIESQNISEGEKINTDNIDKFLTKYGNGFHKYDIASFSDDYILNFFDKIPDNEVLSAEMKAFLFGKIIDSREKYIDLLFEFLDTRDENEEIDDFYKKFNSWFERNIKNKGINE